MALPAPAWLRCGYARLDRAAKVNWLRNACSIAIVVFSVGCVHFFEGTVAELEDAPGLSVELAAQSYGDCFRIGSGVPIVYKVSRPNYTVRIAHGMRYWPEFFLNAHDNNGIPLNITGAGISAVSFPTGGDMRRLREARGGLELSHHTLLDIPRGWDARIRQWLAVKAVRENAIGIKTLAFDIHSASGFVGTEQFSYRVKIVRCKEVDGP